MAARAVGVSVSLAAARTATRRQLARLRHALPRGMTLLAGGAGAPERVTGVTVIRELDRLDAWARRVTGTA